MPSRHHSSSPGPSSRQTTPERLALEDPSRSKCSCGTGDGTGDYIYCDNDACKVGWYHWQCVQVTEPITGTWLCPSCSPSAAFYIKQLVKKPAASSPFPKVEKAEESASSSGKLQEGGSAASSAVPRPKETAERANPKGRQQQQEQEMVFEIENKEVASRGVAVKKPAAKKPKPKWIGWVELTSDGEEDFKKKVDAQWSTEDAVIGKRTRASKSVGGDNEPGSRTLRRNSRRKIIETDSDEEEGKPVYQDQQEAADSEESVYQEEDKKEEVRIQRRASIEIQSDDSNDLEDIMDVNQGPKSVKRRNSDEHSDLRSDPREERQDSQGLLQARFTSGWRNEANASTFEEEDPEESMDMEYQDEIPMVSGGEPSDGSQYVDDDNSSASTEIRAIASNVREAADSHSPAPQSSQVIERATGLAGALEVGAESEGHEDQDPVVVTPVIDLAALYKRQGNRWGEFPESAIRSTLPRLG